MSIHLPIKAALLLFAAALAATAAWGGLLLAPTGVAGPGNVAVDGAGNVVVDGSGNVVKFQ